eukprot:7086711-Alexandrium_andersonii.AAC.1
MESHLPTEAIPEGSSAEPSKKPQPKGLSPCGARECGLASPAELPTGAGAHRVWLQMNSAECQ